MRLLTAVFLLLTFLLSGGCQAQLPLSHTSGQDPSASAEEALVDYFGALAEGRYERAVELYGGSYQPLIDQNPTFDPADKAGLFEQACRVNGYACLKVQQAVYLETDEQDHHHFEVSFQRSDGGQFAINPCCQGIETEAQSRASFRFTVARLGDHYRVLELPVYVP